MHDVYTIIMNKTAACRISCSVINQVNNDDVDAEVGLKLVIDDV